MGITSIAWADYTFNPWWGCEKVSPACAHCYAESWAKRTGQAIWGKDAPRRFFGPKHWNEPLKWDRKAHEAGERRRVFCASMADVFENRSELDEHRNRLWPLMLATSNLDWMLLTKRPEMVEQCVPENWLDGVWPRNVWLGVTAENQATADARIPLLLRTPAAVRFVSYEPALGPIDFKPWLTSLPTSGPGWKLSAGAALEIADIALDWIIVGGESGHHSRAFDLAWARSAVKQCRAVAVPVFVKQLGAVAFDSFYLAGATDQRIYLKDRKGGDIDEFPEGLKVREFPEVRACH